MFDDDQETPNTLNCAFEFNENGKQQMMEFEVRHWMTNHEAGIAEGGKDSNTIGNLFYGSKGYLAVAGYNNYKTWLGRNSERRARQEQGRRPLRQLHRRRAQPQARNPERRRSRKAPRPPCWCTWPTFPTAWAAPSISIRRP